MLRNELLFIQHKFSCSNGKVNKLDVMDCYKDISPKQYIYIEPNKLDIELLKKLSHSIDLIINFEGEINKHSIFITCSLDSKINGIAEIYKLEVSKKEKTIKLNKKQYSKLREKLCCYSKNYKNLF